MHLKTIKNLVVSMVVGTVAFIPVGQAATLNPSTATNTYKTSSSPQSSIVLAAPAATATLAVRDELDGWLDRLIAIESGGNERARVFDSNSRYSYGCLQFQLATFRAYGVRYGIFSDNKSDDELRAMIYSCTTQKQIAREMILENTDNWRHWFNSVRNKNLGAPPKIGTLSDEKLHEALLAKTNF